MILYLLVITDKITSSFTTLSNNYKKYDVDRQKKKNGRSNKKNYCP